MPKQTRKDFAASIKAKYPVYASLNDDDLVERITTKFPVYRNHVDSREEDLARQAAEAPQLPSLATQTVQQQGRGTDGNLFVNTKQTAALPPRERTPIPRPQTTLADVERAGASASFPEQMLLAGEVGLLDPVRSAVTGLTGGAWTPERLAAAPSGEELAATFGGAMLPILGASFIGRSAMGAAGAVQGGVNSYTSQTERNAQEAMATGVPARPVNPLAVVGQAALGGVTAALDPVHGSTTLGKVLSGTVLGPVANAAGVGIEQYMTDGTVDPTDPRWAQQYVIGTGMGAASAAVGAAMPAKTLGEAWREMRGKAAPTAAAAPTPTPAAPDLSSLTGLTIGGKVLAGVQEIPAGTASGTQRQLGLVFGDGTRVSIPFPEGVDASAYLQGLAKSAPVGPTWETMGQQSFGFGKKAGVEGPPVTSDLPEPEAPYTGVPPARGQYALKFRGRVEPGVQGPYTPPAPPPGQQALPFEELQRIEPPPTGALFPDTVDAPVGNVPPAPGQYKLPFRGGGKRGKKAAAVPAAPAAPPDLAAFDNVETINLDAERKPNSGEARKLAKMGYTPDQVNAMTGEQAMTLIANNVQAKGLAGAKGAAATPAAPRLVTPNKGTIIPGFDAQLAGLAGAALVPDDPESEWDETTRAALLAGGVGAMGAAWYRRTGRLPMAQPEAGYSYAYVPKAQLDATIERGKPARFEFLSDINAAKAKVGTGTPGQMDAYVLARVMDDDALPTKGGRIPKPGTRVEVFDPMAERWDAQTVAAPATREPRLAAPPTPRETPRIVEGPDPAGFESFRAFQAAVRSGDLAQAQALKAAVQLDIDTVPTGYLQDIADTYSQFEVLEAAAAGPHRPGVDDLATRLRSQGVEQIAEPTTRAAQATLVPPTEVSKFEAASNAVKASEVEAGVPTKPAKGSKAPKTVNPAALAAFDAADDAPVPGTPVKPTLRRPDGTVAAGAATAPAPLGDLTTQSFDQVPQAVWDDAGRQAQPEFDALPPDAQEALISVLREEAEKIAQQKNLPPRLAIADMLAGGTASAAAYSLAPEDQKKEAALAAALPIPGLYSRLTKNALGLFQKTGAKKLNAASLLARVKSMASSEEIKWTGFADWLKERGQKPVTLDEVKEFLEKNEIQVEEVRLGAPPAPRFEDFKAITQKEWTGGLISQWLKDDMEQRVWAAMQAEKGHAGRAHTRVANEVWNDPTLKNSFSNWQEANAYIGELSRRAYDVWDAARRSAGSTVYGGEIHDRYRTSNENYREFLLTLPSHKGLFESHNWEVERSGLKDTQTEAPPPDVDFDDPRFAAWEAERERAHAPLLHVRTTDRTLPSGRKVLVVEEVQSDLHQELRRRRDANAGRTTLNRDGEEVPAFDGIVSPQRARRLDKLGRYVPAFEGKDHVNAVDAPFSTDAGGMDWQNLAMKRIIRLAAEEGYDSVFFTGGREQAARYGAPELESATWQVSPNRTQVFIDGVKVNGAPYHATHYLDDIPQLIGEGARPILEAAGSPDAKQSGILDPRVLLSKTQKGNLHFYDNVLPDRVNKLLKQFGTELRVASLPRGKTDTSYMGGLYDEADVSGRMVDITPPMRKSVMEMGFDKGFVNQRLLTEGGGALAGAALGAAAGASSTDDAREKRNRAIVGFFAGGLAAGGFAKGLNRFFQRELDAQVARIGKAYIQVEANSPPSKVLSSTLKNLRLGIADAFVPFARLTRELREAGIQSGPAVDAIRRLHDDFYVGAQNTAEQLRHVLSPLQDLTQYRTFFRILRLQRNIELEKARMALAASGNQGAAKRTYLQNATLQETEAALNVLLADVRTNNWTQVDDALLRHTQLMKDVAQKEVLQGRQDPSILKTDVYLPDILLDHASEAMLQPTSTRRRYIKDLKRPFQFRSKGRVPDPTTGLTEKTWNDYVKIVGGRLMMHHLETAKINLVDRLAQVYDPNYGKGLAPGNLQVPPGYSKFNYWNLDLSQPIPPGKQVYVLPTAMHDELVTRFKLPGPVEASLNRFVNREKGYLIRSTMGGYFANNVLGDTVNSLSTAPMIGGSRADWWTNSWAKLIARDITRGALASGVKAFYIDRPNAPGVRQRMWDMAARAQKANIGQGAAAADVSQQVLADPRLLEKTDDPGRMANDLLGKAADLRIDTTVGVRKVLGYGARGYDMLRDFFEGTNRIGRFIHEIEQGKSDAVAGKVVLDAIYDYNDITPFEARFLRGLFVPFWTFTKKSLEAYAPVALTDTGGLRVNMPAWKRYMRTAPFAAAAVVWNHTFYPEAENDLPEWKKNQFHLLLPMGADEDTGEQHLIYIGFPTPKNIAMQAMGLGGLGTRLADYVKGKSDLQDFGKESWEQGTRFWRSLLNPAAQALYGVFSNKDFGSQQQIAPENATWNEWAQAQAVNAVGSLPPFAQLTAGARERAREVGGEGWPTLRRLVTGSIYSPIDREHDAARAAARTLAAGMQEGNDAERALKERLATGEEDSATILRDQLTTDGEIDPRKLPGALKDQWLAKAFSNARMVQVLKRAVFAEIPTEGIPPSAQKLTPEGLVEVPTVPQLAALGPDAALGLALKLKMTSPAAGRQWASGAVEAMKTLRKQDARWDVTDAALKLLQASPSWQEDKALSDAFDKDAKGDQPLIDLNMLRSRIR